MNRAEQVVDVVRTLRQIGVSDRQIAVVLGIKTKSLAWLLVKYRDQGKAAGLPAPTLGLGNHLERAICALVVALGGGVLQHDAALLVVTAHPTRLAMRDAAARLVGHGIIAPEDVAWLLDHLGGAAAVAAGESDTTLAA